jgi:invasion protein IalB
MEKNSTLCEITSKIKEKIRENHIGELKEKKKNTCETCLLLLPLGTLIRDTSSMYSEKKRNSTTKWELSRSCR